MSVGGLGNKSLMRLSIEGDNVTSVVRIEIGRRVRAVRVGPDGAVWMVTDEEDGAAPKLTN